MWLFNIIKSWLCGKPKQKSLPEQSATHKVLQASFLASAPIKGGTLFIGDSHAYLWSEDNNYQFLTMSPPFNNKAVPGDLTEDLLALMPIILRDAPEKIIISIGSNNLGWNTPQSIDRVISDIYKIALDLLVNCGGSPILYLHSTLPACSKIVQDPRGRTVHNILMINGGIKSLVKCIDKLFPNRIYFVDTFSKLTLAGDLRPEYTRQDGYHLNSAGYKVWADILNTLWSNHVSTN